jgi:hypothetical protein
MHTERDVARIVRSWLRTDEHESADHVLDGVLALLDTTPQRRAWRPARRFANVNNIAKLAIAAAAVVVVAVVGINLLPASGGGVGGGPAVSPSPTPSPKPTPSPSPRPVALAFPPAGDLAVGRHSMTLNGVPFAFSVATSGWVSNGIFDIHKATGLTPDGAGFIFWNESPTGVFADPCASLPSPPVGPSAADLAAAVAAVPGTDLVSGPSDVTVGGHPAKHVVLTVREDIKCDAHDFYLWYGPSKDNARYATELGSTIRVWIVDVDGRIVWIDGETYKGAGPEPGQDIQQIVDSIQFE